MFKYWLRQVGLPLVLAVVLFGVAGVRESQAVAFAGLVALLWAGNGGRNYRIYRNSFIRTRANRDARAAFRN